MITGSCCLEGSGLRIRPGTHVRRGHSCLRRCRPFVEARRSRVARAPPCSDAAAALPEAPTETTQALKQLLAQGPAPTRAGPFAAPLVRHAGRLSRLPEVVDRPALDVLLQRLQRAATGLRHLRDDEDQRDRTDG